MKTVFRLLLTAPLPFPLPPLPLLLLFSAGVTGRGTPYELWCIEKLLSERGLTIGNITAPRLSGRAAAASGSSQVPQRKRVRTRVIVLGQRGKNG